MARIRFDQVAHSYLRNPAGPADFALKPLELTFEDGGAYALLGPSGCGKTTLLNIISGLLRPTRGRVFYDDTDVTGMTPAERNIAQVFQFPVIYDTMTVEQNLAFPLRNRRLPEDRVRQRVREVAEMLELENVLARRAAGLTADQKQKISLGRGLVREDVAAILLDEPLTVVDPHLKWQLRRKLKEVHARYNRTLIYVTHDQNEALTFADLVVVMHDGRIVQVGTPQELFERPEHRFVGYFIGSPGMNFLPCRLEQEALRVVDTEVRLQEVWYARGQEHAGAKLELGIRPEHLAFADGPGERNFEVVVQRVEDLGNFRLVTIELGRHRVFAKVREDRLVAEGPMWLHFPVNWTRLYADSERIV